MLQWQWHNDGIVKTGSVYSNLPVKFASLLSSQKIVKKSRFIFLIFTAKQIDHEKVSGLNKS